MELKNLEPGDVILRAEHPPLLFMGYETDPWDGQVICLFMHLETGRHLPWSESSFLILSEGRGWSVLKRSLPV